MTRCPCYLKQLKLDCYIGKHKAAIDESELIEWQRLPPPTLPLKKRHTHTHTLSLSSARPPLPPKKDTFTNAHAHTHTQDTHTHTNTYTHAPTAKTKQKKKKRKKKREKKKETILHVDHLFVYNHITFHIIYLVLAQINQTKKIPENS